MNSIVNSNSLCLEGPHVRNRSATQRCLGELWAFSCDHGASWPSAVIYRIYHDQVARFQCSSSLSTPRGEDIYGRKATPAFCGHYPTYPCGAFFFAFLEGFWGPLQMVTSFLAQTQSLMAEKSVSPNIELPTVEEIVGNQLEPVKSK